MADYQSEITVLIPTLNEELNLSHCLESLRWCPRIIVVDSFSTDKTEEISRSYKGVVFAKHRFESMAAQLNWVLRSGLVQTPWSLLLAADEKVPPDFCASLERRWSEPAHPSTAAYEVPYRVIMWGRWLRYSSEYPLYQRRLFRPDRASILQEGHTEKILVNGQVRRLGADLIHENLRSLADWYGKHNRYSDLEARALLSVDGDSATRVGGRDRNDARRVALKRRLILLPGFHVLYFIYLFLCRRGWMDGIPGYWYCMMRSHYMFQTKLKFKELRMQPRVRG